MVALITSGSSASLSPSNWKGLRVTAVDILGRRGAAHCALQRALQQHVSRDLWRTPAYLGTSDQSHKDQRYSHLYTINRKDRSCWTAAVKRGSC